MFETKPKQKVFWRLGWLCYQVGFISAHNLHQTTHFIQWKYILGNVKKKVIERLDMQMAPSQIYQEVEDFS